MSKSLRIRTKPGEDDGFIKVDVDLKQKYDFLEILSLKISQIEEYQNFCAEYGVVAGRVIVNNGFGVPNVKVSIFIPIEDADVDNPVISKIYPYTEPTNDQKNDNGVRYNLLPNQQQTLDHTPVGSYPEKREVLDDNTTLEVFEKYYKYTTTTNEAGDFILLGIPVGDHTLHYDMDVSDIGFISQRPYELIAQGYNEELFKDRFKFKSSNNLDSLPQIFSGNIPITVEPYWCDSLNVGSTIGINRQDISIDNIEIIPSALFFGSIFSDDEKDSLNKNCRPDRNMGQMNEVITGEGKIEAIRRNQDGAIETFQLPDTSIDENGNWSVQLPMNMRKVVTDEFGNLVPSPDGIKGIATEGDYRFKVSMDATGTDKRLRTRAKFLVPNMTNNFNFKSYSEEEVKNTDDFKINRQLSTITEGTPYEDDLTNEYNYLEEFYTFRWKKVYTVKQYIGRFQKTRNDEGRSFIGIKDIINGDGVNKMPSNRVDTSIHPLYSILCFLVSLFGHIVGIINGIIQVINGLITAICQLKIPVGVAIELRPNKGLRSRPGLQAQRYDSGAGCWKAMNNSGNATGSCGGVSTDSGGTVFGRVGYNSYGACIDVSSRSTPPSDENVDAGCQYHQAQDYLRDTSYVPQGGGLGLPVVIKDLHNYYGAATYIASQGGPTGLNDWWYNFGSCIGATGTDPSWNGCRRFRIGNGSQWYSGAECDKCNLSLPCGSGCIKILGYCICISLKWKCILAPLLCKKCKGYCDGDQHSCCSCHDYGCPDGCNDSFAGLDSVQCCEKCCMKIPLIKLRCQEEDITISPTIFKTPFAPNVCNETYVKPFECTTCGGRQTAGIKDWVSCVLEPVAVWLNMLKFDFYNDWVGGTLYFPLIKRKYVLKKRGRKFGLLKKDKFCDFECKSSKGIFSSTKNFQGPKYYKLDRVKITKPLFSNPTITVDGCNAKIKGKITSNWYGNLDTNQTQNLNNAAQEITLKGSTDSGAGCNITFDSFSQLQSTINDYPSITLDTQQKKAQTEHGRPKYIETTGSNGEDTWVNMGGHAHHRNICNRTFLIERGEYFKDSLDCLTVNGWPTCTTLNLDGDGPLGPPDVTDADLEDGVDGGVTNATWCLDQNGCCPRCSSNGVAACNINCNCSDLSVDYKKEIQHGLISWEDEEIYYTPIIPEDDVMFNNKEYKANLMLPTTIMELGSTTYCDIDDAPFIMDTLPPTTFQASFEQIKYKTQSAGDPRQINSLEDKEGALNLRGYVEFSCFATVCVNAQATVNQSQIGVDLIDTNDIGMEIGNCFLRFDHEPEVREYFCRRFNGYKDGTLDVHYQRPGSNQYENDYQTYSEMTLTGPPAQYVTPEGDIIDNEYNDGDPFVPGDACGFYRESAPTDYFYGIAPGQASSFTTFPNNAEELNFGCSAHSDGVDEIDDDYNGSESIRGIKFNRSQTPYYLYFGLVPGKTALHKTVGKFFADKINYKTLQGIGASDRNVSENINNRPNINNTVKNPYTIYKTCLGETVLPTDDGGSGSGSQTPGGSGTTPLGGVSAPFGGLFGGGTVGSSTGGSTTSGSK
jgi:hypothetical protein